MLRLHSEGLMYALKECLVHICKACHHLQDLSDFVAMYSALHLMYDLGR